MKNSARDLFTKKQEWLGSLVYDEYIEFDTLLNRCMSICSADVHNRMVIDMAYHILLYGYECNERLELIPLTHIANELSIAGCECNMLVYSTFVNAAEIIAYNYPNSEIADAWRLIYYTLIRAFHVSIESISQYKDRINRYKYDADNKRWVLPVTHS